MSKPKKPRGEMAILSGDRGGVRLLRPNIGDSKEELERHVATTFLHCRTDWKRSESCFEWLGIDEAVHNDTSDLDVSLLRGGRLVAYAELVEFAPLRPGFNYVSAETGHDIRQRAEQIFALIARKWTKYRAITTPIFLVVYCTDEVFMPGEASAQLVSHWLYTRADAPGFEGVFLRGVLPGVPNQLLHARVYSEAYKSWVKVSAFDEAQCKGHVYNLRPREFRPA